MKEGDSLLLHPVKHVIETREPTSSNATGDDANTVLRN